MPDFAYSFAADDDVEAVVSLVQSAYRGEQSLTGWTSEAELIGGQRIDAPMLRDLLSEPGAHVLLAEHDDRRRGPEEVSRADRTERNLQACCELREPATPGGVAYFGMFAVRPALQGGGYGRTVLAEAERIAGEDFGARTLEMTVIRQRVTLIEWYERRGYARTGERRPFPYGDDRYGVPRRDDLEMTVLAKSLILG